MSAHRTEHRRTPAVGKAAAAAPHEAAPRTSLQRPRLLALDRGLPLLVIEAPAGYGKSTLAQQWLAQRDARTDAAWVSLEAASRDPVVFLDQVLLALGASARSAGAASFEHEAGRAERFEQLCGLLRERRRDLRLVLDDGHVLAGSASAHDLERLLKLASPRLRICLTSQPARLAVGLGQQAAQGLAAWIGTESLALTRDETAALAALRGVTLTEQQLDWMHEATGGWPSFVQLALATPQGAQPRAAIASSGAVREYLCERFLDALNDDERELLWIVAQLGSTPVALLAELAPPALRVDVSLRRLMSLGIVQARDPQDDSVVRLHGLVREAVAAHVMPAHLRDPVALLRAASDWYRQQGLGAEAIRTALDAGCALHAQARDGLAAHGLALVFRHGQHQTLLDLVERWEAQVPGHDPAVDEAAAWALVFQRRFALAQERILRLAASADVAARSTALLQRAVTAALRDEHEDCGVLAREWLHRHGDTHGFGTAVASAALAFSLKCAGQAQATQQALGEAFHSFNLAQSPYGLGWAQVVGTLACVHTGSYRAALAQIESGLQRYPVAQGFGSLRALLRAVEAFLRYERDELAQVQDLLAEVLGLLVEQGVVDAIALGFSAAARMRGNGGDLGAALDLLSEAEQVGVQREFPRLVALMHAERALLLLRHGSTLRARALIEAIAPQRALRATVQLLQARLALAEGDPAGALDGLGAVHAEARREPRLQVQCEALLLRAYAEELRGHEPQALAALGESLDLAGSEGYVRSLLDERRALAPLARRWLAGTREASPAARHLARRLAGDDGEQKNSGGARVLALNARQREILSLLDQGLSNAQLARRCFLSESTVKWYLHHLYEQLQVSNRTALLRAVRERGIEL